MTANSKIAWTDHTFNPWIGCTKVSDGCKFCYAEELMDKRYKKVEWGPKGARTKTSAANWKKPIQWNKHYWVECSRCGWRDDQKNSMHAGPLMDLCPHCEEDTLFDTRQRVFCASLADVFEDNPQLANWRGELFDLIEATPNLDWLLLTKRPERIFSLGTDAVGEVFDNWMARNPHVWLGTSVESQEHFIPRTTELLKTYAKIHWLSVEPMIRPVRFIPWTNQIDWVICGGESGSKYRPMDLEWARDLRDDCRNLSISFFMKQLGGHPNKRDSMSDFPEDLRIREFPPVKENGYQ